MAAQRRPKGKKSTTRRGPPPPVRTAALRRRRARPPRGAAFATEVAVGALEVGEHLILRRSEDERDRLLVGIDSEGRPEPRRPEAEPVRLTSARLRRTKLDRVAPGTIPDSAILRFVPSEAPRAKLAPPDDDRDRDLGGTIFGSDDRYLFHDRSFPWRTTGQIRTAAGRCSGTTIGPRLVLTASHCVNWDGDGGAGWISFSPGYYDGHRPWGELFATHVIFWNQAPGSLTDQETAFDYVVLVMEDRIGDVIGYPGYRTYHDSWNGGSFWQYVGYPGELSSGERPAFQGDCVISSAQSESLGGRDAFVLGHFNEFTPGQSGGAVWGWWSGEPWPRVVGVGSTIGSTAVQMPSNTTNGDNEYGGGDALSELIGWARANFA